MTAPGTLMYSAEDLAESAEAFLAKKHCSDAVEQACCAYLLQPEQLSHALLFSQALQAHGAYEEAERVLKQAIFVYEADPRVHSALAQLLLLRGRLDAAINASISALEKDKNHLPAAQCINDALSMQLNGTFYLVCFDDPFRNDVNERFCEWNIAFNSLKAHASLVFSEADFKLAYKQIDLKKVCLEKGPQFRKQDTLIIPAGLGPDIGVKTRHLLSRRLLYVSDLSRLSAEAMDHLLAEVKLYEGVIVESANDHEYLETIGAESLLRAPLIMPTLVAQKDSLCKEKSIVYSSERFPLGKLLQAYCEGLENALALKWTDVAGMNDGQLDRAFAKSAIVIDRACAEDMFLLRAMSQACMPFLFTEEQTLNDYLKEHAFACNERSWADIASLLQAIIEDPKLPSRRKALLGSMQARSVGGRAQLDTWVEAIRPQQSWREEGDRLRMEDPSDYTAFIRSEHLEDTAAAAVCMHLKTLLSQGAGRSILDMGGHNWPIEHWVSGDDRYYKMDHSLRRLLNPQVERSGNHYGILSDPLTMPGDGALFDLVIGYFPVENDNPLQLSMAWDKANALLKKGGALYFGMPFEDVTASALMKRTKSAFEKVCYLPYRTWLSVNLHAFDESLRGQLKNQHDLELAPSVRGCRDIMLLAEGKRESLPESSLDAFRKEGSVYVPPGRGLPVIQICEDEDAECAFIVKRIHSLIQEQGSNTDCVILLPHSGMVAQLAAILDEGNLTYQKGLSSGNGICLIGPGDDINEVHDEIIIAALDGNHVWSALSFNEKLNKLISLKGLARKHLVLTAASRRYGQKSELSPLLHEI